jgi:hypothetical protein
MSTVNSGITIRVCPRTLFTFTGLGASGATTIPIAQHIDIAPFTEAELAIRLHSGTTMSAGQTLSFSVLPDGYAFDDPTAVFSGTASTYTTSPVGPPTTPFYNVLQVSGSFGRLLSVNIVATQGSTGGTAFQPAISLDLVLKGGDPGGMATMLNGFRGYRIL